MGGWHTTVKPIQVDVAVTAITAIEVSIDQFPQHSTQFGARQTTIHSHLAGVAFPPLPLVAQIAMHSYLVSLFAVASFSLFAKLTRRKRLRRCKAFQSAAAEFG
jgi:VIT1/CCC1 family predicted Fe2+/Mn2+ transporter